MLAIRRAVAASMRFIGILTPMRVLARLIKHSLNVSVLRPQHADARMHLGIAASSPRPSRSNRQL
jgi:hypothetical protein